MSGLLDGPALTRARLVSEGERLTRGYHVCEGCGRFVKPCYRIHGFVLCVVCLKRRDNKNGRYLR